MEFRLGGPSPIPGDPALVFLHKRSSPTKMRAVVPVNWPDGRQSLLLLAQEKGDQPFLTFAPFWISELLALVPAARRPVLTAIARPSVRHCQNVNR